MWHHVNYTQSDDVIIPRTQIEMTSSFKVHITEVTSLFHVHAKWWHHHSKCKHTQSDVTLTTSLGINTSPVHCFSVLHCRKHMRVLHMVRRNWINGGYILIHIIVWLYIIISNNTKQGWFWFECIMYQSVAKMNECFIHNDRWQLFIYMLRWSILSYCE